MVAMTPSRRTPVLGALLAASALLAWASPVAAHTDTDLVAVAAGDDATLTLEPTHGCDGSPTVEVAIQAPVIGAVAGEVDGWTATSTDDPASGTTVLEWTGGSLPDDATGAFPVMFAVPDDVGQLLVFPSVQVCENGEELSWIDGDPDGEYPAPRVLVLAAGSEPATSIDDVPADAPGRDQLTAVVDVDNPRATTTVPGETGTTDPAADDPATDPDEAPSDMTISAAPVDAAVDGADEDDDDSSALPIVVGGVVLVAAIAGSAWYFTRTRTEE